ncbi:MAG: TetR/AcrR family transcriptional regulator, ethionamide resistance regulator [Solirubrobacteraceae bacterium]|nr:TetR/AcrR family transcriptional regulator, ethionamide resistance regulator [Solirubrobacteraceae bacterium]
MTSSRRRGQTRQNREQTRERIVGAATELVRRRAWSDLSVEEIMAEAGIGRTLFYRHFDDLADLLMTAAGEATGELFEAELALAGTHVENGPEAVRASIASAVAAYHRHGPLLRAIHEAAAGDERVAEGYEAMLARFDQFAEEAVRTAAEAFGGGPTDPAETARALNRLNESYLLDAFGREARTTVEVAERTLTEIWTAVLQRGRD